MEPSVLGTALMGSGPDRKIKLDRSPGVDEVTISVFCTLVLYHIVLFKSPFYSIDK